MSDPRRDATAATRAANEAMAAGLPFEDRRDFEEAARGLIAPLPDGGRVTSSDGRTIWDLSRFDFIHAHAPAPETVNPSLWRQMQLTVQGGLYEVVPGLYQVRTLDLSNITFVEGDTGVIAFDPLISAETAAAALELYHAHRPRRPIVAVVYSHSHVDHFGGIRGIVDEADVTAGKVRIVAPEGFLEAAVAENVLAGNVMSRRASYMYGNLLPADPKGQVGAGLGVTTSAGSVTLIPPTHTVSETGERMTIDGLEFEFMMAPDSEAPAEMHWFIDRFKALTAAENCCHTLHNTYTIRGAKIRDPLAWSKYLEQTVELWGDRVEVMFGMHHWPAWGRERVLELLELGRDGYRFINDETLRLANHGFTPGEIAEQVQFPPRLSRHWAMRGYYGTLNHNVKATYVNYLGWFDGNPANLHTLPPVEAGRRYVAFMGGADALLGRAQGAYELGDYRWVVEVVNHLVFADPSNGAARELQAAALEQLGYQSESGPWRNFHLSAAKELREGVRRFATPSTASADMVRSMSLTLFFDYLGVRLNGAKAGDREIAIACDIPDLGEQWTLLVRNGALSERRGLADGADATLTVARADLDAIILGTATLPDLLAAGTVTLDGDAGAVRDFLGLLDEFDFWFDIVTP
ncbi:alkyl sulfatase dimerization domain-containing protein [Conexibacter sp. JD483]|uniref:alkyl/aryl-sulfatase n=1 Tax=unclassified Conexibacter TaxID=2627773 RepID=UPI00272038A2|nr:MULTISPECIES: alkyl sulfatase dimerization domain-containing protein [unclassified Conexibacter]MDO8188150.1 alkyl sulfatase dimerization domain-containing protein [Conexibacter sp. CPCC 205706]MDO8201286.1 alkyl sulfatase dimerization domain-containing protein [Conexibacter sp. CPCC 205762]MDR9370442.1 alkyl sulfatase dimerization domain-containing protein [Conexibacter sp. JD483]